MSKPPAKRSGRGRPQTGHDPVYTVRLPAELRTALDAYAAAEGLPARSVAIRAILADWLRTHGFSESQIRSTGPATEIVNAMDQAIEGDRSRGKGGRSGKRLASIKETGEEVPQAEWERFEGARKKPKKL